MPGRKPFERSAFAKSLLVRMCTQGIGGAGFAPPMLSHWTDGLHPCLRAQAETTLHEDRVSLHSHIAARNSSMAFAVNLFIPFRIGQMQPLAALPSDALRRSVEVRAVHFEYAPLSVLAETPSDADVGQPHTSADVTVFLRDQAGAAGVVLVEVKLSESGFTPCGSATVAEPSTLLKLGAAQVISASDQALPGQGLNAWLRKRYFLEEHLP
jgi:hypothetical protein